MKFSVISIYLKFINFVAISYSLEAHIHPSLKVFRRRKVLIPIFLGFGVTFYLIMRNFDSEAIRAIQWSWHAWFWMGVTILLVAIRHLAYMYRIRLLTGNLLSWRRSFDVISLWEFASSVTPSVVGGSAVAVYIVNKEGVSPGRSAAIVLVTTFLDELFYVLFVPIVFLIAGAGQIFIQQESYSFFGSKMGITGVFVIGYLLILVLLSIIVFGVFISPQKFKAILIQIFKIRWLHRWQASAEKAGDDIITTSAEMRNQSFFFWIKAFSATVVSWVARFMVVNCLILIVVPLSDHFLVFARQLVMWVILLVSPTPGSSGVAELIFSVFLGDFIPKGLGHPMAFLWRLITFYPYLLLGAVILPAWLKRVYSNYHFPVKSE